MIRNARPLSIILLLPLLFLVRQCTNPNELTADAVFVIKDVYTIDAVNGLQRNRTVIIQGNRILQTGEAASLKVPNHAKIIDGRGKFLIPGLWDAHVHLSFEQDLTPAMFALFLANGVTSIRDMIGHLKEAGVEMMAGTDTPIFFLTPGYSLHEELALLVKGGLTPLEAIEAATLKPAEYFSLDKESGLIEAGMLADLVLLDANPLEDIRNTTRIHAVVSDGKLHDQQALEALLAGLAVRK